MAHKGSKTPAPPPPPPSPVPSWVDDERPYPFDELLSAAQVADLYGHSQTTVLRWAREGKIPIAMQTPGRRRLFRRVDLDPIFYPKAKESLL